MKHKGVTTSIARELESIWRKCWRRIEPGASTASAPTPEALKELHTALALFSKKHEGSVECLSAAAIGVVKGRCLVKSALDWQLPAIGLKAGPTALARGDQWRLVIAWSGFEALLKSVLCLTTDRGPTPDDLRAIVALLDLPAYRPICPPKRKLKDLERWLAMAMQDGTHPVLKFLQVHKGDATVINGWLIEGKQTTSWAESLRLAKAIRNASAHGAISASKIQKWGLRKPCQQLLDDVAVVTGGILALLANDKR